MGPKVITIVGATCSGKTALSLQIAKYFNTEIISADSRQIYKYLNIGTAKPAQSELNKIKHHFINILEPDEDYNVSRYEKNALDKINELLNEGKIPVIAGGSGLYIKALVDGIFDTVDTDEEYRAELLEKKNLYGNEYIYNELMKVDPESAHKMLPQNWKRVMRALEVFYLTGEPISVHQRKHERNVDINFKQFGLRWNREVLYHNIEKRVEMMIELGLVNEVKSILERGFSKKLNSLNTVGYKEIISYLEKEISLDRAVALIKRNTRRFSKRQMTWFRKDDRINWFNITRFEDLQSISDQIIKIIK